MTDGDSAKNPIYLSANGKAPIWINIGLMFTIVMTTGMGVYKFSAIEHSVDKANLSLDSVARTVDKIEASLGITTRAVSGAETGIELVRVKQATLDARQERFDSKLDGLDERVRKLEQGK